MPCAHSLQIKSMVRKKIKVKGVVQGVGFRPFVYRLAETNRLTGYVRNSTDGVDIEVEGRNKSIVRFIAALEKEKPPAARIDRVQIKVIRPRSSRRFVIRKSRHSAGFTEISPDIATCDACRAEMYEPTDRRYRYPFINCTNCGPRYSIILETPYDRQRTSMREFLMCPDCAREFGRVTDRRFHAQPDCCSACGPHYVLRDRDGVMKIKEPIHRAAALLKKGHIVAIKGIGGFHIACDATSSRAVRRLRRLKHRPAKPFALMANLKDIRQIARFGREEKNILISPAAPIVLLEKKGTIIADAVAPQNPYVGIMLPYAPVHYMLLEYIPYIVMTSGNIQDEPIVIDDRAVRKKLGHIVSFSLTHDRTIQNQCDDSVGFYVQRKGFSLMRRSRGYAPAPIETPVTVRPTLAVGPLLKNTFTLARGHDAYVSPHIGDLDNLETLQYFTNMVIKYTRWFKIQPELIVHDLHPDYLSTKLALALPGKKIAVQHHIAHVLSCLGEHMIDDDAVGITFDGTGFGSDAKIWGGEFFIGNIQRLRRIAHLEYLPLPGGESSIRKPYRIAIAYLHTLLNRSIQSLPERALPFRISNREYATIIRMIKTPHNLVYTSSMGRLFDCVSALLGITKEITYEAEAAINLEHCARTTTRGRYPFVIEAGDPYIIRVGSILDGVIRDLSRGIDTGTISARFHNTVAHFSLEMVKKLSRIYDVKAVCLSGGVFQNRYLLLKMLSVLENAGYRVYMHRKLPTNDGCISYGQTIAGNVMTEVR
jgi:hydrogenase maturation protein HypF